MTPSQAKITDIVSRLVAEAVRRGADELDVEYKDGYEEVFATVNGIGFGIASLESSDEEAQALREQLCSIGRKGAVIEAGEASYKVCVSQYDSFGETAYRVRIQR